MTKKYYIGFGVAVLAVVVGIVLHGSGGDTTATQPSKGLYVAMGDSVAAGVGLKDYADASACDRTLQAYPNVVAKQLHYSLQNNSCSGARTDTGILGNQEVNKLSVAPQISRLSSSNKPKLITMTVGANDTSWTTLIGKCYTGTCGTSDDTSQVQQALDGITQNMKQALTDIQKEYPTNTPRVLITGYYDLFPPTPTKDCLELSGIDQGELAWVRQLQMSINVNLQNSLLDYPFAQYVAINFSGHELCTNDSWIQGLNDKQPYHPTDAGQNTIAQQILTTLKDKK